MQIFKKFLSKKIEKIIKIEARQKVIKKMAKRDGWHSLPSKYQNLSYSSEEFRALEKCREKLLNFFPPEIDIKKIVLEKQAARDEFYNQILDQFRLQANPPFSTGRHKHSKSIFIDGKKFKIAAYERLHIAVDVAEGSGDYTVKTVWACSDRGHRLISKSIKRTPANHLTKDYLKRPRKVGSVSKL